MSFLDEMRAGVAKIEEIYVEVAAFCVKELPVVEADIDKVAQFVMKFSPEVTALSRLFGSAAPAVAAGSTAATAIATATDAAYTQHQSDVAAGMSEVSSSIKAALTIANAVAASDITSEDTATKITTITAALPM